jgi:hypothetical protein
LCVKYLKGNKLLNLKKKKVSQIFSLASDTMPCWETIIDFKGQKQGSLNRFRPFMGWGLLRFF